MEKNRHEVLTDKFGIHFFELKKIGKNPNKDNPMELWLQLINAETEEELDMLENTNVQEISKAILVLRELNADENMRRLAEIREKALHDEASAINSAEERGMAKGIVKGIEEGIELTKRVFRLSMQGYSVKQIADELKTSEEQIQDILNQ